MTKLYCANWVFTMEAEPLEGGAVVVEGTRIVGVGSRAQMERRFPDADSDDFGEAVILPGLVNCHTHLELTAMRNFLEDEEDNFFAWLKKVTSSRNERMAAEDIYISAAWGAVEAARAGITCVGDASASAVASMKALREVGLRGIVYQEVFGPDERIAQEQADNLRRQVDQLRVSESTLVTLGVSPHAPYTVSAPLFKLVTEFVLAEQLPLMIHAAESEAERQLLVEGRGPFAESFAKRGVEWHAPGVPTIQYLARLGVLRARPLLAHCIRVDEADIAAIKESGAGVAHCPKSNAKFGHGHAPLASFLEAGLRVGLGSDSVASNNTCDLLEEARFATLVSRASGDKLEGGRMVGSRDVLRAATQGSARAMNLEYQVGALAEGLEADLTVVALSGTHQRPAYDPSSALVFASSGRDVLLTLVAGREVFRDGRITTVDEEELRARMTSIARRLGEV